MTIHQGILYQIQLGYQLSATLMTINSESSNNLPKSNDAPIAVAAALLSAMPLLVWHCSLLWQQAEYQYFPFVLVAVGWLGFQAWTVAAPNSATNGYGWKFHVFFGVAILQLIYGIRVQSTWPLQSAIVLILGAGIAWLESKRRIAGLWWIWSLLWLIVPLPYNLDKPIVLRLQLLSANMSSAILDLCGIDHLLEKVVLTLPERSLFVEEACSGIVSVRSIVAVAFIYCVWKERSLPHTITLLLMAILWAVCTNVARILVIVFGIVYFDIDLSGGTAHDILGLILFGLCFVATMSTDAFLDFIFAPIPTTAGEKTNLLTRTWNKISNMGRALATSNNVLPGAVDCNNVRASSWIWIYASLTVAFCLWGFSREFSTSRQFARVTEHLRALERDFFPSEVGDWQKLDESFLATVRSRSSIEGEFSKTVTYRNSLGNEFVVSVDFPFLHWHDLAICYTRSGWTKAEESVERLSETAYAKNVRYEGKGDARSMFALIDGKNEVMVPPQSIKVANALENILRLFRINLSRFLGVAKDEDRKIYVRPTTQVQVWSAQSSQLADEQRQMLNTFVRLVQEEISIASQ